MDSDGSSLNDRNAVVQEAGSSRYKSALHSQVFDKAVKKYRKRQLQEGKQRPRPVAESSNPASGSRPRNSRHPDGSSHSYRTEDGDGDQPIAERAKESQDIAQHALEALPGEIVRGARTFQNYMQFFVSGATEGIDAIEDQDAEDERGLPKIPPDMRKLLDELADMEHINGRVKTEILQDEDARKVSFVVFCRVVRVLISVRGPRRRCSC